MLRNYVTVAWRNLSRNRLYAVINVGGLGAGLTASIVILLYLHHELSFDRHHSKAERIYRVGMDRGRDGEVDWVAGLPGLVGPLLDEHVPELEAVARVMSVGVLVRPGKDGVEEAGFMRADRNLLRIFDIPFVGGDPTHALADPNTVVLSQSTARRFFGDADPLGQTLEMEVHGIRQDSRVAGVFADLPHTSHLRFDGLLPMDRLTDTDLEWWNPNTHVYALLPEGMSPALIEERLPAFAAAHVPRNRNFRFFLQSLTSLHLNPIGMEPGRPGDVGRLYLFGGVALLVLLVACANFVNLSTAMAAQRFREVGLRKVVGARRRQVVGQFLAEATLTTVGALALALSLVQLVLPACQELFGIPLRLSSVPTWQAAGGGAVLLVLVSGLSGAYAAFHLSSRQPVEALKGRGGQDAGGLGVRRGLVVIQFAISVGLGVITAVLVGQLHYLDTKDLGFLRRDVVVVENAWTLSSRAEAFKQQLYTSNQIERVSGARNMPGYAGGITYGSKVDGESVVTVRYEVDYDFLETLGLELVSGRAFDPERPADVERAMIVNERFAAVFDTATVNLEVVTGWDREIIGTVRDFHVRSLREPIQPVVIALAPATGVGFIYVTVRAGGTAEALEHIERTWQQFVPDRPFSYTFMDDYWEGLYADERLLGRLVGVFGGLAGVVACLGVFGLAAFSAERRTKEIGIRKVLGASASRIVGLLTREVILLVAVASLIAWPLALVASRQWLVGFAYRIELGPGLFLGAAGGVLLLAWLAATWHALRAAHANPTRVLRFE